MSKSNKILPQFLFSAAGIAVMAVLMVAFNIISSALNGRLDMTEEKRYTLSAGTQAILSGGSLVSSICRPSCAVEIETRNTPSGSSGGKNASGSFTSSKMALWRFA